MGVTPRYSNWTNEGGEPLDPLFWVEGYSEDDQLAIASYGGYPYRKSAGQQVPVDPGSPGWDPSDGTGIPPDQIPIAWSQTDPVLQWLNVDPTVPWTDVTQTVPS